MSLWIWLGKERLRELIEAFKPFLDKVMLSVQYLDEMVTAVCQRQLHYADLKFQDVINAEREADEIEQKLVEDALKLYTHPLDREVLLTLLSAIDDIADTAKACARKLKLVKDSIEVPIELGSYCIRICRSCIDAVFYLTESIKKLTSNPKESLDYISKVFQVEDEVDELRLEALKQLTKQRINDYAKTLMKDVIELLESISDKCKTAASTVRKLLIILS